MILEWRLMNKKKWRVWLRAKAYMWSFKPSYRQLQRLCLAGLKGENCPPRNRLSAQPVHPSFLEGLGPSRRARLIHMSAFLAQTPLFRGLGVLTKTVLSMLTQFFSTSMPFLCPPQHPLPPSQVYKMSGVFCSEFLAVRWFPSICLNVWPLPQAVLWEKNGTLGSWCLFLPLAYNISVSGKTWLLLSVCLNWLPQSGSSTALKSKENGNHFNMD